MTRQLFPSPSQGALICAGGEEEGRLAAAPASAGARRQDPTPHFGRGDSRLRAFLGGSWLELGAILLLRAGPGVRSATGAGLAGPGTALGEARGPLLSAACVRVAAAGRRPRRGKATEFPSRRLGSLAGVPAGGAGSFVAVSNPGTSNPFSDQRALPVLKEPGRGGGDSAPPGT